MSIGEERYNKNNYKCIEENGNIDKNIIDMIYDEYVSEKKHSKGFYNNENKMQKDCSSKKSFKIAINCNLKVDFDTENKMIYLHPGKSEFFTVYVSKSCGNVTVKYNGCYSESGIRGNLAMYKIVQSGIIAETYPKLDPRKKDYLCFTAIDECTKEHYDFVVAFSCNLCDC